MKPALAVLLSLLVGPLASLVAEEAPSPDQPVSTTADEQAPQVQGDAAEAGETTDDAPAPVRSGSVDDEESDAPRRRRGLHRSVWDWVPVALIGEPRDDGRIAWRQRAAFSRSDRLPADTWVVYNLPTTDQCRIRVPHAVTDELQVFLAGRNSFGDLPDADAAVLDVDIADLISTAWRPVRDDQGPEGVEGIEETSDLSTQENDSGSAEVAGDWQIAFPVPSQRNHLLLVKAGALARATRLVVEVRRHRFFPVAWDTAVERHLHAWSLATGPAPRDPLLAQQGPAHAWLQALLPGGHWDRVPAVWRERLAAAVELHGQLAFLTDVIGLDGRVRGLQEHLPGERAWIERRRWQQITADEQDEDATDAEPPTQADGSPSREDLAGASDEAVEENATEPSTAEVVVEPEQPVSPEHPMLHCDGLRYQHVSYAEPRRWRIEGPCRLRLITRLPLRSEDGLQVGYGYRFWLGEQDEAVRHETVFDREWEDDPMGNVLARKRTFQMMVPPGSWELVVQPTRDCWLAIETHVRQTQLRWRRSWVGSLQGLQRKAFVDDPELVSAAAEAEAQLPELVGSPAPAADRSSDTSDVEDPWAWYLHGLTCLLERRPAAARLALDRCLALATGDLQLSAACLRLRLDADWVHFKRCLDLLAASEPGDGQLSDSQEAGSWYLGLRHVIVSEYIRSSRALVSAQAAVDIAYPEDDPPWSVQAALAGACLRSPQADGGPTIGLALLDAACRQQPARFGWRLALRDHWWHGSRWSSCPVLDRSAGSSAWRIRSDHWWTIPLVERYWQRQGEPAFARLFDGLLPATVLPAQWPLLSAGPVRLAQSAKAEDRVVRLQHRFVLVDETVDEVDEAEAWRERLGLLGRDRIVSEWQLPQGHWCRLDAKESASTWLGGPSVVAASFRERQRQLFSRSELPAKLQDAWGSSARLVRSYRAEHMDALRSGLTWSCEQHSQVQWLRLRVHSDQAIEGPVRLRLAGGSLPGEASWQRDLLLLPDLAAGFKIRSDARRTFQWHGPLPAGSSLVWVVACDAVEDAPDPAPAWWASVSVRKQRQPMPPHPLLTMSSVPRPAVVDKSEQQAPTELSESDAPDQPQAGSTADDRTSATVASVEHERAEEKPASDRSASGSPNGLDALASAQELQVLSASLALDLPVDERRDLLCRRARVLHALGSNSRAQADLAEALALADSPAAAIPVHALRLDLLDPWRVSQQARASAQTLLAHGHWRPSLVAWLAEVAALDERWDEVDRLLRAWPEHDERLALLADLREAPEALGAWQGTDPALQAVWRSLILERYAARGDWRRGLAWLQRQQPALPDQHPLLLQWRDRLARFAAAAELAADQVIDRSPAALALWQTADDHPVTTTVRSLPRADVVQARARFLDRLDGDDARAGVWYQVDDRGDCRFRVRGPAILSCQVRPAVLDEAQAMTRTVQIVAVVDGFERSWVSLQPRRDPALPGSVALGKRDTFSLPIGVGWHTVQIRARVGRALLRPLLRTAEDLDLAAWEEQSLRRLLGDGSEESGLAEQARLDAQQIVLPARQAESASVLVQMLCGHVPALPAPTASWSEQGALERWQRIWTARLQGEAFPRPVAEAPGWLDVMAGREALPRLVRELLHEADADRHRLLETIIDLRGRYGTNLLDGKVRRSLTVLQPHLHERSLRPTAGSLVRQACELPAWVGDVDVTAPWSGSRLDALMMDMTRPGSVPLRPLQFLELQAASDEAWRLRARIALHRIGPQGSEQPLLDVVAERNGQVLPGRLTLAEDGQHGWWTSDTIPAGPHRIRLAIDYDDQRWRAGLALASSARQQGQEELADDEGWFPLRAWRRFTTYGVGGERRFIGEVAGPLPLVVTVLPEADLPAGALVHLRVLDAHTHEVLAERQLHLPDSLPIRGRIDGRDLSLREPLRLLWWLPYPRSLRIEVGLPEVATASVPVKVGYLAAAVRPDVEKDSEVPDPLPWQAVWVHALADPRRPGVWRDDRLQPENREVVLSKVGRFRFGVLANFEDALEPLDDRSQQSWQAIRAGYDFTFLDNGSWVSAEIWGRQVPDIDAKVIDAYLRTAFPLPADISLDLEARYHDQYETIEAESYRFDARLGQRWHLLDDWTVLLEARAGFWRSFIPSRDVADQLVYEVYSSYRDDHDRWLRLRFANIWRPWRDLHVFADASVTTNRSLRPDDLDRWRMTTGLRAQLGSYEVRGFYEYLLRQEDEDRSESSDEHEFGGSLQGFWTWSPHWHAQPFLRYSYTLEEQGTRFLLGMDVLFGGMPVDHERPRRPFNEYRDWLQVVP